MRGRGARSVGSLSTDRDPTGSVVTANADVGVGRTNRELVDILCARRENQSMVTVASFRNVAVHWLT